MDTAGRKQILETPDVIINPYRHATIVGDYTTNLALQVLCESADNALQEADTTFPEDTDTITLFVDQSGNGNDSTNESGWTYSSSEDAAAASSGQIQFGSVTPGSATTVVSVFKTTTSPTMLVAGDGTSEFVGIMQSGSSSSPHGGSGTPNYYDGNNSVITSATRGDLYTAWATGSYVVACADAIDASTWTLTRALAYASGSFWFTGHMKEFRVYSETLSTANRATVYSALKAKYGIS